MLTVSTKRLIEAIEEADEFSLPDMSAGTEYLYTNLYGRLSRCEDVSLSGLDFSAFELDDVDSMRGIYYDTFEHDEHRAESIMRSLRELMPVTAASVFV